MQRSVAAIHPPFDLLPTLLRGVGVTAQLTVLSALLAFVVAFLMGFGRLSRFRAVRALAAIYVEFFRGSSLLVQLFWAYFVLPFFGVNLSAMQAGVLILGMNYGAYASEIVRSTILAIPKSQTEAGVALNMSPFQIMSRVILPQAFLIMLPPFGNLLIELLKGTALVSLITLSDLMFQGAMLRITTLRSVEVFTLVLIIYFLMAYPLTVGMRKVEGRLAKGRV